MPHITGEKNRQIIKAASQIPRKKLIEAAKIGFKALAIGLNY